MDTTASSPRICIHLADASDAGAIARFERRLPGASRKGNGRGKITSVESAVSVIARDRDSGIVVGHAVAVPAGDGVAKVAVRVAEAYDAHDIGPKLVEQLMRQTRDRGTRIVSPV